MPPAETPVSVGASAQPDAAAAGSELPGPQASGCSTTTTAAQQLAPELQQEQAQADGLRAVALRMRLEMPLKDRIIHLQTFRLSFTGRQAVSFLQQQGLADSAQAATELCQALLARQLFKSVAHKEVFTPDGEVYRFSSSFLDGSKQKSLAKISNITSTGLYKEIAKFGKTAAQPFKNIQLSLNDTFNSLGSLHIPAPAKPGQLSGGGGDASGRLRGAGAGGSGGGLGGLAGRGGLGMAAAARDRRSQSGKILAAYAAAAAADGSSGHGHHAGGTTTLAALLSSIESLQASNKESTSLLRLDLQQHTALQEHLVGLLVAQQAQAQLTLLLIAVNAVAVLLLLGSLGRGWPATLASGCLLAVVAAAVARPWWQRAWPLRRAGGSSSGGSVLQRRSYLAGAGGLQERQGPRPLRGAGGVASGDLDRDGAGAANHLRRSSLAVPGAASAAGAVGAAGGAAGAAAGAGADVESDEVDDHDEDAVPYSDDFDEWPDAPVMLCPDPAAANQEFQVESLGPCHALRCNSDPLPFESPLFKGVVGVFIRHLPSTPTALFKGKKRMAWVALQGTFKRPLSMDAVVYGMAFGRPLSNLPAAWFLDNMLLPLARKISPSLLVGSLEEPYFFTPLITASQVVNVAAPGQQPALMEAKEDMTPLAGELAGRAGDGLTVASRRRFFQQAGNREGHAFTCEHVWTFHLWQEYIDYAQYMLNLGYTSYDLTQHMDGQPLQIMAKDMSTGEHIIGLHVWHAALVRAAQRTFPRPPRYRRYSNVSEGDAAQEQRATHDGGDSSAGPVSPSYEPCAAPASTHHPQQQQDAHATPQQQGDGGDDDAGLPHLHQQRHSQQQQQQQQQHEEDAPPEQQQHDDHDYEARHHALPLLHQPGAAGHRHALEGSSSTRMEPTRHTSFNQAAARSASDSRLSRGAIVQELQDAAVRARHSSSSMSEAHQASFSSGSNVRVVAGSSDVLPQPSAVRVARAVQAQQLSACAAAEQPQTWRSARGSVSATNTPRRNAGAGGGRGRGGRGGSGDEGASVSEDGGLVAAAARVSMQESRSLRFLSADSGDELAVAEGAPAAPLSQLSASTQQSAAGSSHPLQQQQQRSASALARSGSIASSFAAAGGGTGAPGSGSGSSGASPLRQQKEQTEQQQKEQTEQQQKEQHQRKQLQGLSIMGGL